MLWSIERWAKDGLHKEMQKSNMGRFDEDGGTRLERTRFGIVLKEQRVEREARVSTQKQSMHCRGCTSIHQYQ